MLLNMQNYKEKFRYPTIGVIAFLSFFVSPLWTSYIVAYILCLVPLNRFTVTISLFICMFVRFMFYIGYYLINLCYVVLEDCSFEWNILRERYLFKDNIVNTLLSALLGIFGLIGIGNLRNKLYKRTIINIVLGIMLFFSLISNILITPNVMDILNRYNLFLALFFSLLWWECLIDTFLCTANIKNDEKILPLNKKVYIVLYLVFGLWFIAALIKINII